MYAPVIFVGVERLMLKEMPEVGVAADVHAVSTFPSKHILAAVSLLPSAPSAKLASVMSTITCFGKPVFVASSPIMHSASCVTDSQLSKEHAGPSLTAM
jgi:hypothetical protein